VHPESPSVTLPRVLELSGVSKAFGTNRAVDAVSLAIAAGEIVGLVGENGAGKTTLMRIVAGELAPDSGTLAVEGTNVRLRSARDADARGIEMVHQHFMLVGELTIAENLALIRREAFRFATARTIREEAARAIAASGIELGDPGRRVDTLSVGERAKLELIKAIAKKPRLLILDEPTSVLTPQEAEELFRVVRRLSAEGTAIVFISHKLPEVLGIAQRVIVMRTGRLVAESETKAVTAEELAKAMVGAVEVRNPESAASATTPPAQRVSLAVEGLEGERLGGVTFHVAGGELLAIVGVAGNGQAELAAMLRGLIAPNAGRIALGEVAMSRRALLATSLLAHIPEDRTRDGIVAELSVAENIALTAPRWRPAEASERARRLIAQYGIRARGPRQRAGALSGGNQQKVILARELDRQPSVIVAAEPTRGLDLESTRFVHARLRDAVGGGAAVLLITSDLDEAFALADALHVIYRGRLSERLAPAAAAARLANLMAGVA
jgi:ABC-type uncharacterized transport system ATPase subunit